MNWNRRVTLPFHGRLDNKTLPEGVRVRRISKILPAEQSRTNELNVPDHQCPTALNCRHLLGNLSRQPNRVVFCV